MAHIKCRYRKYYCDRGHDISNAGAINCESGHCTAYYAEHKKLPDGTIYISDWCEHLSSSKCEFEGNYKSYEYEENYNALCDGLLRVPRKDTILKDDIEYLEIDGRVLIDEEGGQA